MPPATHDHSHAPTPTPTPTPSHAHSPIHGQDVELARILELDAAVHHRYLFELTNWLRGLATGIRVRRVLDIGAGTGSGTIALAQRFPAAHVVATDLSESRLERVRELALLDGLAERVSTERADVMTDLPRLGEFDLAWASASLHEVSDADQAFRNLHGALRPGGILAVIEMDEVPRTLPDEFAELEERLHAALGRIHAPQMDHPDWTDSLTRAGFDMIATRVFPLDQLEDGTGHAGEYATLYLRRLTLAATPQLSEPDRALLTALLGDGPDSLRQRTDLRIRGTRTAWIARRP